MNEQLDKLLIANEKLQREVENLTKRTQINEEFTKGILETMKKSEELFELRTSRVLLDLFRGITHSLEHSIEHAQEQLRLETQGFDIKVVNGETVKETNMSILVAKTETGYNFSPATEPTKIMNENTQAFCEYFNRYPEVFGDRTEILVNISMLAKPPVGQEGA